MVEEYNDINKYDHEFEVQFQDIDYILRLYVKDDYLNVTIEEESSGHTWKNKFNKKYIEEITHKTGNFKRFKIFINMLASAFTQKSDAVFVDLLTYQDLENLRSRQSGEGKTILLRIF